MLQEQFNEMVFAAENRLLASEGIPVDEGGLQSSATRLALMTRMLQSLDDQCRLGEHGSDDEFCQEIGQRHTVRGMCQLEQRGTFSITHYAGKVLYTAEGFVLKNSDSMQSDSQALMRQCAALAPVLAILFPSEQAMPESGRSSAFEEMSGRTSSFADASPPDPTQRHGACAVQASSKVKGALLAALFTSGGGGGAADAKKKAKASAPTLGARLRAGIGQVSSKGMLPSGLMGRLRQTSVHYVRCIKPNDSMAAFGFEQRRVLQQLQYSGILEMVRIRRLDFPSRMPTHEFEARFAPLLLDLGKSGRDALKKTRSSLSRIVTRRASLSEKAQTDSAHATASKAGRGGALAILERAKLFEHRHYVFGKTPLFLRNGVEAMLVAAVQKQMLALLWFQKTARMRAAKRWFKSHVKALVLLQAHGRRLVVFVAIQRLLRNRRRRLDAIRVLRSAKLLAKTISARGPAWLAHRRQAAHQCQRLGRGYLGRQRAARQRVLKSRPKPLVKLCWAFHTHMLAFRWARAIQAASYAALVELQPPDSTPAHAPERRAYLVELLRAAAEAAKAGESELALRGFATAFAVSRASPLLLLAANILLKIGSAESLSAAEQTYEALRHESGLSPDQAALLPYKLELVRRMARERLVAGVELMTPEMMCRTTSICHQLIDRAVLKELAGSAGWAESTPDPAQGIGASGGSGSYIHI